MSVIQLCRLWTCATLSALEVLHSDFLLAGSSLQAKAVHIMCKTQSFELPVHRPSCWATYSSIAQCESALHASADNNIMINMP